MLQLLVSHWWLFLIRGILALAFGVACLVFPIAALWVIALLFGVYAFVDGIVAVVASIRMNHAGGRWGWLLLEGILGILAGLVVFAYPGLAALTLALLLGAWAIVTGVLAIASAFSARRHVPNEWLWVLSGVVSLIFGIAIFWSPAFGLFALVWMVAFYAILAGIFLIGFSFRLRGVGQHAGVAA
jgi:uncharacterized membrane protein HdeD (DUF308 family)